MTRTWPQLDGGDSHVYWNPAPAICQPLQSWSADVKVSAKARANYPPLEALGEVMRTLSSLATGMRAGPPQELS